MIKATSQIFFEIEKNDNRYIFAMPTSAPLGEAYDVAFEILHEIVKQAQNAASKVERKEAEEESTEQVDS